MRKSNYDRLREAYQQYNDAETAYMKACEGDDDTDRWENTFWTSAQTC